MKNKFYLKTCLLMILNIITFTSSAHIILDYEYSGTYNDKTIFLISKNTIKINFYHSYSDIYVDNNIVGESDGNGNFVLDVIPYEDGKIHTLTVKWVSVTAECYFIVLNENDLYDGFYYSVNEGNACIYSAKKDINDIILKETFTKDGIDYPVTSVGDCAFIQCSGLTSISIPTSITSIGIASFNGCSALKEVTFSDSEKAIELGYNTYNYSGTGKGLFADCPIETLYLGRPYTIINYSSSYTYKSYPQSYGYSPFPSTISTLTIGNNITSVPAYFLYNGSQIESLTIPNSVTSIGYGAFLNLNSKLKSLTIGSGLLSIGDYAFSTRTSSSYQYTIPKVFWMGNTPPTGYNNIKASVNYVSNDQYSLNNQLQYQFLSSKFTVNGAIYVPVSPSERTCDVVDCDYSLQNGDIIIGDKVSNRGVELTVLNVNDYSFYKNQTITSLTTNNKGNVGNSSFYDCDALITVNATNQGYIGSSAFYNCDNLNSVIANNNGYIGESSFYGCDALTSVELNNSGYIGQKAFYDSDGPFTLKVSNNSYIGRQAFAGCTGLTDVEISSKGNIEYNAFGDCNSIISAKIDNVGSIAEQAFYNCNKMTNVVLGGSITTIGAKAFAKCSSLPRIQIPNNITSIGEYIFNECSKLEYARIGSGITIIPQYSFANCSSLNNLNIPSNVSNIGNYVFSGCSSLSNLTFEEGKNASILQLGSNGSNPLFASCPLDEVYIGRKLSYNTSSSYGYSPFYRNTSLRTVEITDAETQIYDNEFYGCTNLSSLKIGNGVKTIGNWAFSGCSSLDYFSAGYMVESIGTEAFSDCTGLTKYYSYSIVPPVCGDQALDDINKWDCTLYVPDESSDEYQAAPQWKDFFFIEEMDAVLVAELRLNLTEVTLAPTNTVQLTAQILPTNATDKTVIWSSSNPEIATVNSDGLVSAISDGTATIIVKSSDGNSEATCIVTVDSEYNGVESIVSDSWSPIEVYNLNGYKVADSTDNLASGIYIIRQGTKTYKISVK